MRVVQFDGGRGDGVRDRTGWLTAHDPGLVALRRALRVTAAACVGFFVCRYAIGLPTLATYAVFGTIAFGFLSDVSGPPALRTRTYLAALPVGARARRDRDGGGPFDARGGGRDARRGVRGGVRGRRRPAHRGPRQRPAAVLRAPLLPPVRPRARCPQRLGGLTIGLLLVAAADRLLWPAPGPRAAPRSARRRRRRRRPVRRRRPPAAPTTSAGGGRGRGRGAAPEHAALRRPADRPGPSGPRADPRDAGAADDRRPHQLLAGCSPTSATPPRAGTPTPSWASSTTRSPAARRRCAGQGRRRRAARWSRASRTTSTAARSASRRRDRTTSCRPSCASAGSRPRSPRPHGRSSWRRGRPRRPARPARRHRPRRPGTSACRPRSCGGEGSAAHLTPRSVYFQNAVRLALGLAAARLAADLLDLSHGFWVLLATLSLMRTSLVASGLALVPAFLGTLGGAVGRRGRAALVGDDTLVYAVALPSPWSSRSSQGPCSGPPRRSSGSPSSSSVLFAQLAPTTWRLAEVRVLDVVVGGLVGALIGAAVWPRGGAGRGPPLGRGVPPVGRRRAGRRSVRDITGDLTATPGSIGRCTAPAVDRLTALFDITYAQYRSEPARADAAARLAAGARGRAAGGVGRRGAARPLPDPGPAALARACRGGWSRRPRTSRRRSARRRRPYSRTSAEPPDRHLVERLDADPPHARFADDPHAALRVIDAWGWIHGLALDLGRAEHAAHTETPTAR